MVASQRVRPTLADHLESLLLLLKSAATREKPAWQGAVGGLWRQPAQSWALSARLSNLNGLEGTSSLAEPVGQHGPHSSSGTLSRGPAKSLLDAGPSGTAGSSAQAAGLAVVCRTELDNRAGRASPPPPLPCETPRLPSTPTCPRHPPRGWGAQRPRGDSGSPCPHRRPGLVGVLSSWQH